MSKDQIRGAGSEPSEPTEPAERTGRAEPASPGAFLRSVIAATRPPLLQKTVARRLGVSPGTVSDWLRNRHVPRWDHLELLEQLLIEHGVDLDPGLLAERFQVQARDDDPDSAPPSVVHCHTPAPLTPLVGRDEEVERLTTLWGQHRLVCITGPAGVGKSRLAAAVADRINEKTPGDVLWLRIDSPGGVDELYAMIALALHARTSVGGSVLSAIARAMGTEQRTIVLDDLDKIDDVGHGAVVRLLERCAGLRIIATARRGIQSTGAARFRVDPLAVPDENTHEVDAREYPAIRLFAALATQAGTGQAVTESIDQVSGICRALGGLPLCLELAAAQLDTITLHELHKQVTGHGHVTLPLQTWMADGDAVLRAALESSWNTLSPLVRLALACSSVFSGPFDADGAARVMALSPEAATSALHELVRSSMVQVDHSKLESRYHILGPVRHFAAQRLDETGDGEKVRTRHAEHLARILRAQFPLSHTDAVAQISCSDLRNALQWSSEDDPALSMRIAGNLWPHWLRVGAFVTGRAWLARFVHSNTGEIAGAARVVVGAGVMAQREGDTALAASLLADGLRLARDEADVPAQQVAIVNLGWSALIDGRRDDAVERGEHVLEQTSPNEHRWGAAAARTLLGTVKMLEDDPRASDDFETSLVISTSIADAAGAISARLQLSHLALRGGDVRRAQSYATAGLADAERVNDRSLTGAALAVAGVVAKADGGWDEAVPLLERAADLMGRSEEPTARRRARLDPAGVPPAGPDATHQAIADILAATDVVDESIRVMLRSCFQTMGDAPS
jgi:predicted ATPase